MTIKSTNAIIPSPSNTSILNPTIIPVCISFHAYGSSYHLDFSVLVTLPSLHHQGGWGEGRMIICWGKWVYPNDIIDAGSIKMSVSHGIS